MSECDLRVKTKRRNKYNSYKGEITPAVPNAIAVIFTLMHQILNGLLI